MTDQQPPDPDSWIEYRRLVLAELERINEWLSKIEERTQTTRRDVAVLQVKCGMWGAAAAVIVSLAAALLK